MSWKTWQCSLFWRRHAQVGPKRRKSGKREKSSSSSWHYLTAKTAVRQSLLLPPEVALHPLQPDVLTRCERARLGSAIRSEGTPPSVRSEEHTSELQSP